jgi:restriction endonuclease Mrr
MFFKRKKPAEDALKTQRIEQPVQLEPKSIFSKAICIIVQTGQASTSFLQRKLKIGFSHATAIIDMFENLNYIGPLQDGKRDIYITANELPKAVKALDDAVANYERERAQAASEMIASESITDMLNKIDAMSEHGIEFEELTVKLLLANGFNKARTTQGSGDYGIDVIAEKDGVTYAIQCKCYSGSVGNKVVQEAFSGKAYYNCMVAVVFTNNHYTAAAIETARVTNVVLWDREKLIEFLKKAECLHNLLTIE